MPTKPLDRLMFAQGGACFFCKKPLDKHEASVEHLLASSNGGHNSDDNCVACCKAINALLGSMTLKEKIQVVLNQKGDFKCPNNTEMKKLASGLKPAPKSRGHQPNQEKSVPNSALASKVALNPDFSEIRCPTCKNKTVTIGINGSKNCHKCGTSFMY